MDALIDVTQLLKEPIGSSQSHDLDGAISGEVEGCVQGKAKVTHANRGVFVQCRLDVEVQLTCSRCLEAFRYRTDFTVEEEFLPTSEVPSDSALSSLTQSDEFTIDDKNMLDLGELIRQYVLLNLPMKPLCRADCPGIG